MGYIVIERYYDDGRIEAALLPNTGITPGRFSDSLSDTYIDAYPTLVRALRAFTNTLPCIFA